MSKPRFEELDGCINCHAYRAHKFPSYDQIGCREGIPLHEAMGCCIISGCFENGHDILRPYIGNQELIQYFRRHKDELPLGATENVVRILKERNQEVPSDIGELVNT